MYNSAFFSDRYKCIDKIGQGGMASVYLVEDLNIHKRWALKLVSKKSCDINLVKSEITHLKALDYYLFPRIVDAFKSDKGICIVTDYIEGETVESYLKREGAMPVNMVLHYFEELLLGLIYLHSMNPQILYLDMKPGNIMIRPDSEIRLIDFGIARSVLFKSKSYGSIGYSPPEQYEMDGFLTEKTDIFALAMTVYSMLTGKPPAKEIGRQRQNIRNSEKIPVFLKEILLKCTEEDIDKRLGTRETLTLLRGDKARHKGTVAIILSTAMVSGLFIFLFIALMKYADLNVREHYKREMIESASAEIVNGEYSLDGLKIICGYLDGNFLDDETESYFTYEVAKNYFEVQKDYGAAKTYFQRLDENIYPDARYYIDLCNEMREFTDNDKRVMELMSIEMDKGENNGKS